MLKGKFIIIYIMVNIVFFINQMFHIISNISYNKNKII